VCLINKAQTWSIDILVAVFIFVAVFIMFTGIMVSMSKSQDNRMLSEKGEKITKLLSTESPVSFIKGNKVDDSKLKQIVGNYDALKTEFNYEKFCVYFEDENGNLIPIKGYQVDEYGSPILDLNGDPIIVEYNALGNKDASVNTVPCGVKK